MIYNRHTLHRIIYTTATILLITTLPRTSSANEVTMGFQTGGVYVMDDSLYTVSKNPWLGGINIYGGYELFDNFSLLLAFQFGMQDDDIFEDIEQMFELYGGVLEAVYAYQLLDGLDVYGKLGVGCYFASYQATFDNTTYKATDLFVPGGKASIGLETYIPRSKLHKKHSNYDDFTIGLTLEFGYSLAPDLNFEELKQDRELSDEKISRSAIDGGTVSFTGIFLQAGMIVHF